ncbi:hypothetical protein HN873_024288, partial [Arachis hypogaea]
ISRASSSPTIEKTRHPLSESIASSFSSPPPPSPPLRHPVHAGKYKWQTYKEVCEMIQKVGSFIRSCGYGQGVKCGINGANCPGWIISMEACNAQGFYCVPLYDTLAISLAKQEGLLVSLDLASFEMVRKFKLPLMKLLESGNIDLCFSNQDEATELQKDEYNADPVAAVEFLAKYCKRNVVTLGHNGCIAKHGKEVRKLPQL